MPRLLFSPPFKVIPISGDISHFFSYFFTLPPLLLELAFLDPALEAVELDELLREEDADEELPV